MNLKVEDYFQNGRRPVLANFLRRCRSGSSSPPYFANQFGSHELASFGNGLLVLGCSPIQKIVVVMLGTKGGKEKGVPPADPFSVALLAAA